MQVTDANLINYALCETYSHLLVVPDKLTHEELMVGGLVLPHILSPFLSFFSFIIYNRKWLLFEARDAFLS